MQPPLDGRPFFLQITCMHIVPTQVFSNVHNVMLHAISSPYVLHSFNVDNFGVGGVLVRVVYFAVYLIVVLLYS